jgi:hypothetical protein
LLRPWLVQVKVAPTDQTIIPKVTSSRLCLKVIGYTLESFLVGGGGVFIKCKF